jgi:hypothetical protein
MNKVPIAGAIQIQVYDSQSICGSIFRLRKDCRDRRDGL